MAGKKRVGRPPTGLSEDQELVRGPAVLLEAMRTRSRETGIPVVALWRKAAELYLSTTEPPT